MYSHTFISVTDFDRAYRFYSVLIVVLELDERFFDPELPRAVWQSDEGRSYFAICHPFNGEPHDPGNGQMVVFAATSRGQVDRAYDVALTRGGTSDGEPGPRPRYHEDYYGAYFRDADGNKLCVACHEV